MRRLLSAAALLCLASGCLTSRTIQSVSEHGERNLTLIRTQDQWTYVPLFWVMNKDQYWTCRTDTDAVRCAKTCDSAKSDLACVTSFSFGSDDANTAHQSRSQ